MPKLYTFFYEQNHTRCGFDGCFFYSVCYFQGSSMYQAQVFHYFIFARDEAREIPEHAKYTLYHAIPPNWIIFHYMTGPHVIFPFTYTRIFSLFHLWELANIIAMNTHVQASMWTCALVSLDHSRRNHRLRFIFSLYIFRRQCIRIQVPHIPPLAYFASYSYLDKASSSWEGSSFRNCLLPTGSRTLYLLYSCNKLPLRQCTKPSSPP